MERRKFLLGTGAVAAGAWVAPQIESMAQTAPPGTAAATCTGTAYDLLGIFTGPIAGQAGPLKQSPVDVDSAESCAVDLTATIPSTTKPLATIKVDCVENDFTNGLCTTRVTLTGVTIDLTSLVGTPFVIETGEAGVLESIATISCDDATTDGRIIGLTINGAAVANLDQPITVVLPEPLNTTLATLGISVVLKLNETITSVDKIERNAIHLTLSVPSLIGAPQTLDLKVAHAEADIHGCPP